MDMKCDTLEMIPPVVAMSRVSITRAPVHSGKQGGILTFLGYPRAGTPQSSWAGARVLRVANCGNGHGELRLLSIDINNQHMWSPSGGHRNVRIPPTTIPCGLLSTNTTNLIHNNLLFVNTVSQLSPVSAIQKPAPAPQPGLSPH